MEHKNNNVAGQLNARIVMCMIRNIAEAHDLNRILEQENKEEKHIKMHYVMLKRYGEFVPAIKWEGNVYSIADYIGETVGKVRLVFFDEEDKKIRNPGRR